MSEEIKALAYDAIMAYFLRNDIYLSLAEAVRVVGGEKRLEALMAEGQIEEKDNKATKKNCKRLFKAADVYAHVRTYRNTRK